MSLLSQKMPHHHTVGLNWPTHAEPQAHALPQAPALPQPVRKTRHRCYGCGYVYEYRRPQAGATPAGATQQHHSHHAKGPRCTKCGLRPQQVPVSARVRGFCTQMFRALTLC